MTCRFIRVLAWQTRSWAVGSGRGSQPYRLEHRLLPQTGFLATTPAWQTVSAPALHNPSLMWWAIRRPTSPTSHSQVSGRSSTILPHLRPHVVSRSEILPGTFSSTRGALTSIWRYLNSSQSLNAYASNFVRKLSTYSITSNTHG